MTRRGRRADGGFTLLELLIALAILSVGLTVLLAAFSRGLERGREGQTEAGARALAAAVLARNLAEPDQAFGVTTGTVNGYAWRVRVLAYGSPDDEAAWQRTAALVQVAVTWHEPRRSRTITLTSLRLIPRADS